MDLIYSLNVFYYTNFWRSRRNWPWDYDTLRAWYQTDVPPKSTWKSVKLSLTPIRQYFCTSGLVWWQSSGIWSGQKLCTQLSLRTMAGTSTTSDSLGNEKIFISWKIAQQRIRRRSLPNFDSFDEFRLNFGRTLFQPDFGYPDPDRNPALNLENIQCISHTDLDYPNPLLIRRFSCERICPVKRGLTYFHLSLHTLQKMWFYFIKSQHDSE